MTIRDLLMPHHNARPIGARIGAIILHDTGGRDVAGTLSWFADPKSRVSSHYLIGRDGYTWRLVPEDRRAWHVGESSLFGRDDLNSWSLGIELVDWDDGTPYPAPQMTALIELVADCCRRHLIPLNHVVGHEHIALPRGRKVDPGRDFTWFAFLLAVAQAVEPSPRER